jgi:hypothetical protein
MCDDTHRRTQIGKQKCGFETMYGTEDNSPENDNEIETSNTSLSTQSRPFVDDAEMKSKIRADEIPRESCGFRIIAWPRVAKETVVGIGDLNIDVLFAGTLAFVHDSSNLFCADVFIESAPEKQDRRMQISNSRQERRRDSSAVK